MPLCVRLPISLADDDPTTLSSSPLSSSPVKSSPIGTASSGSAARIAAVRDRDKRREKLAKSKSSASIGGGHSVSFDDDACYIGERRGSMLSTRRPSIAGTSSAGGVANVLGTQASARRKSTSNTGEIIPSSDDSASLSSWARYLKNKYGKSKSVERKSSTDDSGRGSLSPRSSISLAGAGGNQYLMKKKLKFKFGSRGSEPGHFTWPRVSNA